MSTNQFSTKWIEISHCPGSNYPTVPTGMDKNNYIVIDHDRLCTKINCIHKYDINDDKWIEIDGFNKYDIYNDKWIEIDGFNNMENLHGFSNALDVKKQTLFLLHRNCLTQMQLNNNNISYDTHNVEMNSPQDSKSIIVNNSLFIVGGSCNNVILEWNSKSKALTKFSDMYNKMYIRDFEMIYNNLTGCLLLFVGYDQD
eukprot:94292_1